MKTSSIVIVGVLGLFLLKRHKEKAAVAKALGSDSVITTAPQAPSVSAVAPASLVAPVLLAPPDYADPESMPIRQAVPVDTASDIIVW